LNIRILPKAAELFEKLPPALRRHRLMTAWMRLTGEDPLQLVRIRDESFGYADMSDGFLRLIVIDGDFEKDFFNLADAFLGEGGVFLDVGANHGLLSFGLAGRHGDKIQFHLFEPNPALVSSIKKSLALYPSMRCTVNAAAVSDHVGVVSFLIDTNQTGASHIADDAPDQVATVTLDDYLERAGINRVELLKMDVEGYELVALRGARRNLETQAIQAVYFEYFEKWLVRVSLPQELLEFLQSLEYEICFCRVGDIKPRGGATHTIRDGLPGYGVSLLPIRGHPLPEMTDLLAVPRRALVQLADRATSRISASSAHTFMSR
jgi:FkbM family methyltransferase